MANDDHLRAVNYLPRGIDFGTSPGCYWTPKGICFNQAGKQSRILPESAQSYPRRRSLQTIEPTVH